MNNQKLPVSLHHRKLFKGCLCPGCWLQVAAERAAWDICKQEGINLITILPGFVLGPVTSTRPDATSTEVFQVCVQQGCLALD